MKSNFIVLLTLLAFHSFSQRPYSQDYNREVALYQAKRFFLSNVLKTNTEPVKFQMDPIVAATSGELTSLLYLCPDKSLNGLIFAFYGDYWNEAGVVYKGYGFRNIPEKQALELVGLIDQNLQIALDYCYKDQTFNNISFTYEDLTFLYYYEIEDAPYLTIRVFWKDFDSEWNPREFKKTRKAVEHNFK